MKHKRAQSSLPGSVEAHRDLIARSDGVVSSATLGCRKPEPAQSGSLKKAGFRMGHSRALTILVSRKQCSLLIAARNESVFRGRKWATGLRFGVGGAE